MPWQQRRNNRFYYKAVRIDGQPRQMYLGSGPAARIHELLDRELGRKHRAENAERDARAAEVDADNRLWKPILAWTRCLAATSLLLAGWYNHRGEWRKVMGNPRTRQHVTPATPEQSTELLAQLQALNARANAGTPGALDELRRFLDEHPEVSEALGDLSRLTRVATLNRITRRDSASRESCQQDLDRWREELLGPDPTAIERSLVDVAVSARLALASAELHAHSEIPVVAARNARTLNQAQHRLSTVLKKLHDVQRTRMDCKAGAQPRPPENPPMARAG